MAENSREAELKITADASGVRAGVEQAKTALKGLADESQKQAKRAGDSIKGIGDSFDEFVGPPTREAAKQVEQATKSIIGSVERATAALKAGERGSAGYFEALGKQRGVSAEALAPYIAQLREAEAAQKKATAGLGAMGVSAGQTAAALRQVPAQFTDIVTSLAAGQAPLTVLLQQGGQLKDSFGGAGAAARALGGYVLGLINPFTVAAAAVAALGYAYYKGEEESRSFQKTLILTGNAAGTTALQLSTIAASISGFGVTQGAAADALNQLAASGKVGADNLGRFAAAAVQLQRVGGPAVEDTVKAFAELGKDPLQASLKLNESTNFLTASLYQQIKALEEQGRATEAAKVAQEAFAAVIEDRFPKLQANLGLIESSWLRIKDAIKGAADSALNIGRPETLDDLQRKLFDLQTKRNEAAGNGFFTGTRRTTVVTAELDAEIAKVEKKTAELLKQQFIGDVLAKQDADRLKTVQARTEFDKIVGANLDKEAKLRLEIQRIENLGLAAGKTRAEIEAQIAAAKERARDKSTDSAALRLQEQEASLLERLAGLSGNYQQSLRNLQDIKKRNNLTDEQYVELVQQLIKDQPFAVKLAKEQADAAKQVADAQQRGNDVYEKTLDALKQSGDAVAKQVQKLRDEEEALGVSAALNVSLAQAIELVTIKRLDEQRARALATNDQASADAIQREIDARKELATLIGKKSAEDAAKKSAEDAAKEWTRASNEIERTLTDSLMRGFESGKGFAENLRDTVVNLFKTLILRPTIQAIVQPIAGLLLGGASSAASAAGSAGSALGGLGSLSSLLGLQGIGSALSGGAQLTLNGGTGLALEGAGSLIGSGNILQGLAQGAGALGPIAALLAASYYGGKAISGGLSIGGLGGSGGLSAALSLGGGAILGPLGALVGGLGGGLINRAFGRGPVEARDSGIQGSISGGDLTGQLFQDWFQKGGWFRSNKSGTNFAALDAVTEAGIDASAKAILANTQAWATALQLPADQLASITTTFKTKLTGNTEEDQKAIAGILQGYSDALTAGFAAQVAPFQASGETAAQTLERLAGSLTGVNGVLSALGQSLLTVGVVGGDTASKLLAQFGSLQAFQQAGTQFLQDYYSEAEKTALATQALTTQLSAVGVSLPASRDAYRALVEAQDLNTEAGRKAYAALLQLAPAFAALVPATQSAAEAAAQAAADMEAAAARMAEAGRKVLADLAAQQGDLQVELLRAQGKAEEAATLERQQALAKLTEGLSAADTAAATAAYDLVLGLKAQIQATNDAKSAAEQAAQAAQAAAQAEAQRVAAIASERDSLVTRLLQAQGDTAGLRARELAGLDESNRALLERIFAIEDEKAAQAAAAQAAQEAAQAAQQLRQAWQSVTDSIFDEVARIRGALGGNSATSLAAAQRDFFITTAQARAGDQEAAKLLPGLSQTLLQLAEQSAGSLLDIQRIRAQVAASLEQTGTGLATRFGLSLPKFDTGTNYVPQTMAAIVHEGEAIVPRRFNPAATGGAGAAGGAEVAALLRELLDALKAGDLSTVKLQTELNKVLKRWDSEGLPKERIEA